MFIFDSSAFINGSQHHYYLDTMGSVWALIEEAIDDGRVVIPREVFREVVEQEDAISELVRRHEAAVAEPSQNVQARVGRFQQLFPRPGVRDRADPFIMAEAEIRGYSVVTYEGITFSGAPARGADKKLPAICAGVGIACGTLPDALRQLGLSV